MWWEENNVISDLQFACKKGFSCTHAAFLLKETVATSLEASDKCYVAFYDVAKALDTVWIDGLFIQLWDATYRVKPGEYYIDVILTSDVVSEFGDTCLPA